MPRYTPGTKTAYDTVDRERAMRRVLKLRLAPNSRALKITTKLMNMQRTQCSAESTANELAFFLEWCQSRGLDPFKITEDDIDAFIGRLSGYAQGTQHLKLLWARAFYKRAIKDRYVRENPVTIPAQIRRTPETNTPALTKEQIEEVLGAIRVEFTNPRVGLRAKRDYAMIMLMVRLCLRTTETVSLRWGRIRESNGEMQVSFRGKGGKPAHLPIPADVWQVLTSWKYAYEKATGTVLGPNDPVFLPVSSRDLPLARLRKGRSPLKPMTRYPIHGVVVERLGAVGIEGARFSPHCLRATGAVLSFRAGSSLIEIQALLRHSSIETTMRYLQTLVMGAVGPAIERIKLDVLSWSEEEAEAESPVELDGVPDEAA